ncbi:MAG: TonB family protein [Pseudomonadota bacterium]
MITKVSAYPYKLRRAIVISAIAHVAIYALFTAAPGLRTPLYEKPIRVTWVELPKGTSDEIGLGIKETKTLPKTTLEEQKKLLEPKQTALEAKKEKTELAKKEMPEPRPKMTLPDKTKVRRAETPRPKPVSNKMAQALAKIDKQLAERSAVPEAAQIGVSGEGYKYGTGTKPLKSLPSDPEYLKYQAQVRWKIMREWIVPAKFTEEGSRLNARIEVMINMDGDVVSVRWASRSGNASFDQSALRAVKKASPFPKPPDKLAWEAYNEGFLVDFDPRIKAKY